MSKSDKLRLDYFIKQENWHFLCINYSNQLPYWFNSNKFDWKYSVFLIKYCEKYFKTWWHPDKVHFYEVVIKELEYSKKFHKWFWNV